MGFDKVLFTFIKHEYVAPSGITEGMWDRSSVTENLSLETLTLIIKCFFMTLNIDDQMSNTQKLKVPPVEFAGSISLLLTVAVSHYLS